MNFFYIPFRQKEGTVRNKGFTSLTQSSKELIKIRERGGSSSTGHNHKYWLVAPQLTGESVIDR